MCFSAVHPVAERAGELQSWKDIYMRFPWLEGWGEKGLSLAENNSVIVFFSLLHGYPSGFCLFFQWEREVISISTMQYLTRWIRK